MTPVPQPPPLRFRSGARGFWTALGILVVLAMIAVALFYAEEDWRGARALAAVQRDLEAKGETLDWRRSVPPPVPDDQNLAMAPLFVRELAYRTDPKTRTYTFGPLGQRPKDLKEMPYAGDKPRNAKLANFELARHANLPGYQRFFRQKADFPSPAQPGNAAADVLLALTRYRAPLDELARAAAERPLTCFPVDWNRQEFWGLDLPQHALLQGLVRTLCLRASAQLASGRPDDAGRDLELSLRLCRDLRADHVTVGYLTEITCLNLILGPLWEGLADRQWTAGQLTRFQMDLPDFDLLAGFTDAMRLERAATVYDIDYIKRRHDVTFIATAAGEEHNPAVVAWVHLLGWLVPAGWFDLNKAAVSRYTQDHLIGMVDPLAHRFFAARVPVGERALATMRQSRPLALAQLLVTVLGSIGSKSAQIQTSVDHAMTACALERCFLDQHAYPERLDALVPSYLARVPVDVNDGAPLHYHRTPNGRYVLYAVGFNGKDDGGRIEWEDNSYLDPQKGDWVWQYTELHNPLTDK